MGKIKPGLRKPLETIYEKNTNKSEEKKSKEKLIDTFETINLNQTSEKKKIKLKEVKVSELEDINSLLDNYGKKNMKVKIPSSLREIDLELDSHQPQHYSSSKLKKNKFKEDNLDMVKSLIGSATKIATHHNKENSENDSNLNYVSFVVDLGIQVGKNENETAIFVPGNALISESPFHAFPLDPDEKSKNVININWSKKARQIEMKKLLEEKENMEDEQIEE